MTEKLRQILLLVLTSLFCASIAQSTLPLTIVSNAFSSNMVLQREPMRANIWGWTGAGKSVTLTLTGQPVPVSKTVNADATGKWMMKLDPMPAGGPYVLQVTSGTDSVNMTNVMFGDVIYCSGQSNMAYGLNTIYDGDVEANMVKNYTHIRILALPTIAAPSPFDPTKPNLVLNMTNRYGWKVPDYGFVYSFSAICWLTGRHLSDSQNKTVPIGLVHGAWSGQPIEPFMRSAVAANTECPAKDPMTSTIYNTMVYPLFPMQFTSMAWYQGEANIGRRDYGCMLGRMIQDYRKMFQNDFTFMEIQYAPRNLTGDSIPITRQQMQMGAERAGHHCLISNIDLGNPLEPDYGHPKTKGPLGYRCQLCIRKLYFNETDLIFSGPIPKCTVADHDKDTLTIKFYRGTIGTGLEIREALCPNVTEPAKLCRCAWEIYNGTNWYPAEYSLSEDKQSLVLSGVTLPTNLSVVQYRNGWAGWPLSVLYNSANLPPANYVNSLQPDCDVDEIYQPDAPISPIASSDSPIVPSSPSSPSQVPSTSQLSSAHRLFATFHLVVLLLHLSL